MAKSCVGCKFLYAQDEGYSNWTVTDTDIRCAKDRNENLPASEPFDWNGDADSDNWPKTNASRCELYADGPMIKLDCDGEEGPASQTSDEEVIEAICAHAGIGRNGHE